MCNLCYIRNALKLLYLLRRIDEQLCWRSKELPPEIQYTVFNVKTIFLILGRHRCLSVKSVRGLATSNHSSNIDSLTWTFELYLCRPGPSRPYIILCHRILRFSKFNVRLSGNIPQPRETGAFSARRVLHTNSDVCTLWHRRCEQWCFLTSDLYDCCCCCADGYDL